MQFGSLLWKDFTSFYSHQRCMEIAVILGSYQHILASLLVGSHCGVNLLFSGDLNSLLCTYSPIVFLKNQVPCVTELQGFFRLEYNFFVSYMYCKYFSLPFCLLLFIVYNIYIMLYTVFLYYMYYLLSYNGDITCQVYNIMIQYLHILGNDHHKSLTSVSIHISSLLIFTSNIYWCIPSARTFKL